jgi:hypothetical protein
MHSAGNKWGLDSNADIWWYFYVNERFVGEAEGSD